MIFSLLTRGVDTCSGAGMFWNLKIAGFFRFPKKEVHVIGLAVNHGCLEDPVLGSFFDIFGDFFSKKYHQWYKENLPKK